MSLIQQLAKHVREIHFGGNWTCSNLKDQLADVSWQEATTQVYSLNTIAALTYHVNYYVDAALKVLQRQPLIAKDAYSYSHPPIQSPEDWQKLLDKVWNDAETFAKLIEHLPEEKLWEDFTDPKYGLYYRNIHGIVEHMHYHLGQIAVIKKIIRAQKNDER
jgi:hypothetical protein